MKRTLPVIFGIFLLSLSALAQRKPGAIHFKSGDFTGDKNLQRNRFTSSQLHSLKFRNKYYALIQFAKTPGAEEQKSLLQYGVNLFRYLPGNAWYAEIDTSANWKQLKSLQVTGIYAVGKKYKISRRLESDLANNRLPQNSWIAVNFFGTMSRREIEQVLVREGAQLSEAKIKPRNTIFIAATGNVLQKIAALPYISFLDEQALKDIPINYNNRSAHSLDALNSTSGRNLQGKNVALGIGDNGDPSTHVDFTGRMNNRNPTAPANHSTHTTGTMGGGGILNPMYRGMAPKATIIADYFSDVLVNSPTYITDYNMVATNNSYFSGAAGCPGEGDYDALSSYVDDEMNFFPSLLHVFAAGNDGGLNCTPYSGSFATIKSGFQTGKNVLTVGAVDNTVAGSPSSNFSSRGPVDDGRLKPEIVAGGTAVISTFPNNNYSVVNGTSMAAPTVTGTSALLYERYRQLHSGADPSAALIKAVICNGGDDLGNPGPDFIYGFGKLNARNAVEAIENNTIFTGSVSNGGTSVFTITGVPAGTQQLKVMLYWSDPAAAPYAATTLVNDLDLTTTEPGGSIVHQPLILNPAAASVNLNAAEGADHLNNIEQVVINNPPAGNFTVTVNGTNIPAGPQNFVVAYRIISSAVIVEYPFGNETWVPAQTENIRWSAGDPNTNTFTIEYSTDNGSTWNIISSTVPATSRSFAWTVPAVVTDAALIRVTRNVAGISDVSDFAFTIVGQPVLTVTNPCKGYAQLSWGAITSATSYDIMQLKGDSMEVIANTASTSYLVSGLNASTSYWFGVRAVVNSSPGRRALSKNITPSGGACSLSAFDNDYSIDSLFSPVTGRMHTLSQLGVAFPQAEVRNLGSIPSSGSFQVSYRVNGGTIVNETISPSIAANSVYTHTFSTSFDFSAAGSYTIETWVQYPGDPTSSNDTLRATIKQLLNDPVTLAPSFTEGFESATVNSYTSRTMGLDGLDRADFNTSSTNGRARTLAGTGFPRTGSRCITLDQTRYSATSSADSLITTYNLSSYVPSDQIWLDFYYVNHGTDFSLGGNQVWIRGSETDVWIPVTTLSIDPAAFGIYQAAASIDVTGTLAAAVPAQTISSSFQVKFGEQGFTSANSMPPQGNIDDGYSFDDVKITKADNDISLKALTAPVTTGNCGLSNAETITVQVKNYSTSLVHAATATYRINGTPVTETLPDINPGATISYSFVATADLSAYQQYTLDVWVNFVSDNYHANDSLMNTVFQTTPLISSFPYLEGFESGNGNWYTGGINSSWAWGIPAKTIINKAANGTKAWVTNLAGNYNDNELSYLYSPCFNLSGMTQPVFSFSHIFREEDNCNCDFHWVEYTTDDITWTKLGVSGSGTNWYDNALVQEWQLSNTKWHVSSFDVPVTAPKVRFRIVMSSDPATNYEGIGIDDIHIFDKAAIYSGVNLSSGITQPVSGSGWINFDAGGKRVASINPNGQNLGSTTVKAFFNPGAIRTSSNQYYLNRNLVIQPTNTPASPVSVRFYFLDTEAQALMNATGCGTCTTINDPYVSGVTQYSNAPLEEDGTLANNATGSYSFHKPQVDVTVIPYDNGYYAEYQVTGFSEFWINGGGPLQDMPLPVRLTDFTATRINDKGLLQWTTETESNTNRFVIEKGSDGVQFAPIGSVPAAGNSNTLLQYKFTDSTLWSGTNYYRLKIFDNDGKFSLSPVRTISTGNDLFAITLYPNPVVKSVLNINTSAICRLIEIHDVTGGLVRSFIASGRINTLNLSSVGKGIYFVTVVTDAGKKIEKILVE